ncbi:hypothetical protein HZH68_005270 [Vespula germanica]|uniref:Uncharacterized protein n=1 Tax=Vespula germanica TaxID=30212 RepID=A0A834KKV3_VESGE|nr:hypothetical protein HZH68_005270 [Vespula germanica]
MSTIFKPILKTFEASNYDKRRHKTRFENLEFMSYQAFNVSLYSSDIHELLMRFSLVTTSIGHLDILRQQACIRSFSNNFVWLWSPGHYGKANYNEIFYEKK